MDGLVFAVNPTLSDMLGFSEVAARGRALTDFTHPTETARAREALGRVLSGGVEQYSTERRLVTANGDVLPTFVDVVLVRGDERQPLFVVVMVIPRDNAFAALRDQVRGVAHDLNNLLTAVIGHAEVLTLKDGGEHAELIRDSGLRAAALVRKMLVPESMPQQAETLDVNEMIVGMSAVASQLVGVGVDIVLRLDPSAPRVIARREELERAFGNLAANARDAMPDGGQLMIETRVADDMVEIAVTDSGVGIPKDLQAKIFERDYSTKPSDRGFGIGLANVVDFVKHSGGTIRVESEPGHGATFTLALPKSP
jgi:PAS domain S-box-containing protein